DYVYWLAGDRAKHKRIETCPFQKDRDSVHLRLRVDGTYLPMFKLGSHEGAARPHVLGFGTFGWIKKTSGNLDKTRCRTFCHFMT
ncbi:MAG: hypothetical protein NWR52_04330, partial [Paracoccaceae bacterium]|nr:hypothetical protein [Paracoccaceae bacterium]